MTQTAGIAGKLSHIEVVPDIRRAVDHIAGDNDDDDLGNQADVAAGRELIPPITAFLEEDLKLVHTGGNLTPGDGVGSRRSFKTPTQKLTVVKPPCYLPTRVT